MRKFRKGKLILSEEKVASRRMPAAVTLIEIYSVAKVLGMLCEAVYTIQYNTIPYNTIHT